MCTTWTDKKMLVSQIQLGRKNEKEKQKCGKKKSKNRLLASKKWNSSHSSVQNVEKNSNRFPGRNRLGKIRVTRVPEELIEFAHGSFSAFKWTSTEFRSFRRNEPTACKRSLFSFE